MDYGEERGWWERTGDILYEKEQWKKIPTERFQHYANMTMNMVSSDMSQDQSVWLYSHIYTIPYYETFNPFAVVLGFLVLDWKTQLICGKRFKKITEKYAKKLQLTSTDVLRYGRKWQETWLPELI